MACWGGKWRCSWGSRARGRKWWGQVGDAMACGFFNPVGLSCVGLSGAWCFSTSARRAGCCPRGAPPLTPAGGVMEPLCGDLLRLPPHDRRYFRRWAAVRPHACAMASAPAGSKRSAPKRLTCRLACRPARQLTKPRRSRSATPPAGVRGGRPRGQRPPRNTSQLQNPTDAKKAGRTRTSSTTNSYPPHQCN